MEIALFVVIAATAVAAAVAVIAVPQAIYSALFLVLNFFCLALIYLALGAEFLAAIQIIIYAGAIMVLFLFVITLLNPGVPDPIDRFTGQRVLALTFGVILLVQLILTVVAAGARTGVLASATPSGQPSSYTNLQMVGALLFTRFLIPFEVTSVLLLVAMVGALVLARRRL